jgi:hypothetical protein
MWQVKNHPAAEQFFLNSIYFLNKTAERFAI